jgi:uncharacterized membrane protein
MDADKRKNVVATVIAMNIILFVIAILTLGVILYYTGFDRTFQLTPHRIIGAILYAILPVLGITTYILSFVHRNKMGSKNVWLLGSINSGIWAIIFLVLFIFGVLISAVSGILLFFCLCYFVVLYDYNRKLYGFEKNQELSQFEVNT